MYIPCTLCLCLFSLLLLLLSFLGPLEDGRLTILAGLDLSLLPSIGHQRFAPFELGYHLPQLFFPLQSLLEFAVLPLACSSHPGLLSYHQIIALQLFLGGSVERSVYQLGNSVEVFLGRKILCLLLRLNEDGVRIFGFIVKAMQRRL